VLRSAAKLGDIADRDELISFARKSGLRAGGLPITDGYDLAVLGGLLRADHPTLSEFGLDILSRCLEEEPSPEVLRVFLSIFLLRHPPAWVAYWQGDPPSLDIVLPDAAKQILSDAEITSQPPPRDLETWALWAALRTVPQSQDTAEQRKVVGTAAERLSLSYEQQRLATEGYPALAARVRWVARESPAYGFDILSFCGTNSNGRVPETQRAIEVKGQTLVARPNFSFFLTKHEWRTATALGDDSYIFHFWHGVNPADLPTATNSAPVRAVASMLEHHVRLSPPCAANCNWETTLISLQL
jgi:hypothetical protein